MYCDKCGCTLRVTTQQTDLNIGGTPILRKYGQCPQCGKKYDLDGGSSTTQKSASKLSILALVFSIFAVTFLIGIILAIVDLKSNDDYHHHTCSWIAIGIGVAVVILATFALGR